MRGLSFRCAVCGHFGGRCGVVFVATAEGAETPSMMACSVRCTEKVPKSAGTAEWHARKVAA